MSTFKSELNEIEGVYRFQIEVPYDVNFVCVYLFKLGNKNILFDAGLDFKKWSKAFFSLLEEASISMREIDYCIISHHHLDHIGLLKEFKQKNPQIQILMHEVTNNILQQENDFKNFKELKAEAQPVVERMVKFGLSEVLGKKILRWYSMWPKLTKYYAPDKIFHDGDEIYFGKSKIKIIWTPGHSLGHICVFDQDHKHLFAGDHILSRITPHIGSFPVNPLPEEKFNFENILDHYLKSLDKIDKLNPKIIFPAHQDVIYNPHERILEIKEHHQNRLNEISRIIKDNPLTPFQISQIHFGNDLDPINAFLALNETVSHLIYLENQGKVKRIDKNTYYDFYSF
ncbi:MAG: MBL fold metallo-hydrolase [Candidatus Helarchaeota archaeon]|nr:MBL fold metallo-hydrolase [Candidatus Helarchaeota archaeon]